MSKSLPLAKPKATLNQEQVISELVQMTCISEASVREILRALPVLIAQKNAEGYAVRLNRFATFHLRKRTFSPERRKNFKMGKCSLPEFCYYPYAEFSTIVRKNIASRKDYIDQNYNNNE